MERHRTCWINPVRSRSRHCNYQSLTSLPLSASLGLSIPPDMQRLESWRSSGN